jgi:hypothetical protein
MTKCPRTFFPGRNVLCIFLVFSALIVADPCVVLTLYRIQAVENLVETWVSPEALRATGGNPKASLTLPNKWIANPSQHNIRPPPPIRDGSYKYTARDTSPKGRIVQGKNVRGHLGRGRISITTGKIMEEGGSKNSTPSPQIL